MIFLHVCAIWGSQHKPLFGTVTWTGRQPHLYLYILITNYLVPLVHLIVISMVYRPLQTGNMEAEHGFSVGNFMLPTRKFRIYLLKPERLQQEFLVTSGSPKPTLFLTINGFFRFL